jgi:hypothetical protein
MILRNIEATNTALTASFVDGAILTTYYKTTPTDDVPCWPGRLRRHETVRDKDLSPFITCGDPG